MYLFFPATRWLKVDSRWFVEPIIWSISCLHLWKMISVWSRYGGVSNTYVVEVVTQIIFFFHTFLHVINTAGKMGNWRRKYSEKWTQILLVNKQSCLENVLAKRKEIGFFRMNQYFEIVISTVFDLNLFKFRIRFLKIGIRNQINCMNSNFTLKI